jgi:hypothetical protein
MQTIYKKKQIVLVVLIFSLNMVFQGYSFAHGSDKPRSLVVVDNEVELAVENWMLDLGAWEEYTYKTEFVNEQELVVEDWMIQASPEYWQGTSPVQVKEEDLMIENWMTDLTQW